MIMHQTKTTLAVLTTTACVGFSNASTIDSASFNAVTSGAVSTAGTADWGYLSFDDALSNGIFDSDLPGSYNNTLFGNLKNGTGNTLTTVSGSSSIGQVTLTEGAGGTDTVDSRGNASNYTFDGNIAHGEFGSLAASEQDVWTLKFNDLGVGTFTITLYMGHTATNRSFDFDAVLADGGPALDTDTTASGAISGLGSTVPAQGASTGLAFTYSITVTTTSATEDLSLTFGSISGSAGSAYLSGYTVVPEPGSLALLGLGGMLIGTRRRRD